MKGGRDDDDGGEDAERKKKEASSRLMQACKVGDVEAARQATADGANVDVREVDEDDDNEWFPLRYAADPEYGNSIEVVQMLIDAGCDVNQADEKGNTALNWVIYGRGKVSVVEALLRGGVDPNIANKKGYTPCHFAQTVDKLGLVLDAGGDPREKSDSDVTPFQYRRWMDGSDNVKHLRAIYEAWTPHRMLPRWRAYAFPLYIEQCSGFKQGIITLLLCLRRYRHMIPKEFGTMVVEYVAEMHRKEMWWPAWEDFCMAEYM